MSEFDFKIEGMTIAITKMEEMLTFYENVFQIKFEEKAMFGSKLYAGVWGNLNLLFCPAKIAGNTATQNRHQFDIIVPNLQKTIEKATRFGGKTMSDIVEDDSSSSVGIYDPDNNSILFKQLK